MNARVRFVTVNLILLLASAFAFAASTPVLTSISPASAYINGPAFTLTVNGTGFVSGDTVYLTYNVPLTTTFVSATKLTAQVPAANLTYASNYGVYVETLANGQSNTETFSVVDLTPTLQSIAPLSVVANSTPTPLTITGSNFMSGAVVRWNGKVMPTTYLNSGELQVTPTKPQLGSSAIVPITVTNPAPGGVSDSQNFNVTYPATITTLDLPANDIVWDPYAQLIYASMPSSYGINGNTIAVINPANGKIIAYHFAGSEPSALALSSDSQYLYVGLNGNGSVQRFILPSFTPDIDVPLPNNGSIATAIEIGVSPSDDHTWSVGLGSEGCCNSNNGVYFYKDATQLSNSITSYPYVDDFVWVSSTTMYGYGSGTISLISVTSSGGTITQQWSGDTNGSSISYAAGLLYGNDGKVFNPSSGLLTGSFDVTGSCCYTYGQVLPDAPINRFYALEQTPFFAGFGITAYNLTQFTPVAVANLSQVSEYSSSTFILWGNSGAAFLTIAQCCNGQPNQLQLVKSPAMFLTAGTGTNPVPTAKSLSPSSATHGGLNFPITITGTNFVPGSTVTWNGAALYAAYASATQLTLYVPASDIATAGTAQVIVTNPAPGGGSTAPLTFTIK
jgi:trimeric autotransporter adhesin